jgi:hypothetical protein
MADHPAILRSGPSTDQTFSTSAPKDSRAMSSLDLKQPFGRHHRIVAPTRIGTHGIGSAVRFYDGKSCPSAPKSHFQA